MRNVDENEPSSVPERATRSAYVRLPSSPSRAYGIGMPAEEARWTLDMVRALPDDGNRYEVLDGVLLVTPIPTLLHQRAIGETSGAGEREHGNTDGCSKSRLKNGIPAREALINSANEMKSEAH